jgi:hypothetical protein
MNSFDFYGTKQYDYNLFQDTSISRSKQLEAAVPPSKMIE